MQGCSHYYSKGVRPDPNITMVEWADRYMYLPQESTKEYGKYYSSRTPYAREIMYELSPQSKTQIVIFQKPTQMAATTVSNIFLFYYADLFPCPCMHASPTTSMAEKHSKKRVAPSILKIPRLKEKIKEAKAKNSGNTILIKEFPGGSWTFTGSNSPVQARSDSIKCLILDDYDGFEESAGAEGEPGDLFCKRTDTFGDSKKIFKNSTPTVKNVSKIEREYLASSMATYHVPCPKCKEFFELLWGYLKFDKAKVENETIYMECPHCKTKIKEYQKTKMMAKGEWKHEHKDREIKGYKISGLYSPVGWVSWKQIIDEFLAAQGNVEKLKVWNNTRMAETFEQAGDQPEWHRLKAACESYEPMTVPDGVHIITAGVDTHDDRLDIVIRGWGVDEESWLIYWGQLWGCPGRPEVWEQLALLLNYNYKKHDGQSIRLGWVSIDAMGHYTGDVYQFCRRKYPIVIPIKGASTPSSQILNGARRVDINYRGQVIKNGIEIWSVGTNLAKMTIYQRLKQETKGRGFYHNYIGLNDEYFLQLTAEKLVTKYTDGFPKQKWVVTRPGGANHALDCFDDTTEVLTAEGWKLFKNIFYEDALATVNMNNNLIEYQIPTHLVKKKYYGDMINFRTPRIDILVTPGHRMIVEKNSGKRGDVGWRGVLSIEKAENVNKSSAIKIVSGWKGNDTKNFTIPSGKEQQKDVTVDMYDFAELLGWFVTKGHTFVGKSKTQGNMRYRFAISQNPGAHSDKIANLLNRLPWKWYLANNRQFIINSQALVLWVIKHCGCGVINKKIPLCIKESSSGIINRFLDAAIAGDGWVQNGHRTYVTISERLADDIQELFLKIGRSATITKRPVEKLNGGIIRGRKVIPKHSQYHISEIRSKRAHLRIKSGAIKKKYYEGNVYCATVPNGTLLCRRNKKTFFAGNCEVYCYHAALRAGIDRISTNQLPPIVKKQRRIISKGVLL